MATELATAYISLVPSMRGARAAIAQELNSSAVTAAATQAGDNIGRNVKAGIDRAKVSESLLQIGTAGAAGGAIAALGLYKAAQAAGDLGEAVNKANVVLGESGSKQVQKFAEDAVTTAGLSKRAATDAATTFAVFGKSADLSGRELVGFSTSLAQLAGDLASFSNTTTEEAITAIGAALRGESEPIRQYGVLLDDLTLKARASAMGIYDGIGPLTQQQRVLAAQAEILAQTSDAQGDFLRTSDSLANQQRILAAEFENTKAVIGEALLPVVNSVVGAGADVLGLFTSLPAPVQQSATQLAAFGTAGALAVGGFALLVGGGMKAIDTLSEFSDRLQGTRFAIKDADGNMTKLGRTLAGLGVALTAVAAIDFADSIRAGVVEAGRLDTATKDYAISLSGSNEEVLRAFSELAGAQKDSLFTEIPEVFGKNIAVMPDMANETIEDIQKAFESLDLKGQDRLISAIVEYQRTLDPASQQFKDLQTLLANLGQRYGRNVLAAQANTDATDDNADATDDAAASSEAFAKALDQVKARAALATLGIDAAAAGADAFGTALDNATSTDNLLAAGLKVGTSLRSLRQDLGLIPKDSDKAKDSIDETAEAVDRLRDAAGGLAPELSALGIRLGGLDAAASGFLSSIDDSTGMDDLADSALAAGSAFSDFRSQLRRIPADFDAAAAATGAYSEKQTEAIGVVAKLGQSARDYLADLLRSGQTNAQVAAEAERLRAAYVAQFQALGLTNEQIQKYLQLMGLTPEQVTTALKVSGFEKARFQINTYLQLLEGRIPESVATAVAAAIERDDLDAAAATLAQWAATNPVKVDVGLDDDGAASETLARLPAEFDPVKAALGQYSEEEERALEGVLALGDATKAYLQELVGSGKQEEARQYAAKLREGFVAQAEQLGLTREQAERYADEVLGLDGKTINTAIELAGVQEAITKLELLKAFAETNLTPKAPGFEEVNNAVAALVSEGNFQAAADLYARWVRDLQDGALNDPIVQAVMTDTEPARAFYERWKADMQDGAINDPIVQAVTANTGFAKGTIARFRFDESRNPVVIPVVVAVTPQQAREAAAAASAAGVYAWFGAAGGRATGGPVSARTPYLVGEIGPELFVPNMNGTILTARQTANLASAAGGSSSPTLNVTVERVSDDSVVDDIGRGAMRAAALMGW